MAEKIAEEKETLENDHDADHNEYQKKVKAYMLLSFGFRMLVGFSICCTARIRTRG